MEATLGVVMSTYSKPWLAFRGILGNEDPMLQGRCMHMVLRVVPVDASTKILVVVMVVVVRDFA